MILKQQAANGLIHHSATPNFVGTGMSLHDQQVTNIKGARHSLCIRRLKLGDVV